jgi:acid stress chaperone HdeA
MKTPALLAIGLSLAMSIAFADTPAVAPSKIVKPGALTCEAFLMYDDVTRPQIVFWTEGSTKKGKPGEEVLDVDRTNTLVPMIVDECTRAPKAAFIKKVHEVSSKAPASPEAK